MNHTSIKKISLTTLALVAAFAVSAYANGPRDLLSSHRSPAKVPAWVPNSLAAVYQYDDGSSENAVGFGNGLMNDESLWFNQFAVIPGQNVIESVSIAWGTPANSTDASLLNGLPITAAIWSDPNGDGNPSDGKLIASVDGVMANANTDTFVTYTFDSPVTIPGNSFFIGNLTPAVPTDERFMESIDQSSTARKSWIAAMSSGGPVDINTLGNNDFIGIIDDFGIPGNWLIRANPSSGGGIVLEASVRRQQGGNRVVALHWSPADGGSVNVLKNGVVLHGVPTDDDGAVQDNLRHHTGTFTYQVCETDTGNCSNEVTVVVR